MSSTLAPSPAVGKDEALEAAMSSQKSVLARLADGGGNFSESSGGASSVGMVLTTNGVATLAVPGSDVEVSIPVAISEQFGSVGPIAVVITVLPPNLTFAFSDSDAGMSIESPATILNLFALTSRQELDATNLAEPITMKLSNDPPGGAKCAYWMTSEKRWSPAGVRTETSSSGSTICSTVHLSMFAAVRNKISCANHILFSPEALERAYKEWRNLKSVYRWIFVLAFAIQLGILVYLEIVDYMEQRKHRWRDEYFLTSDAQFCISPVAVGFVGWMSFLHAFRSAKERANTGGRKAACEVVDAVEEHFLTLLLECVLGCFCRRCKKARRAGSFLKEICMGINKGLKDAGCLCSLDAWKRLGSMMAVLIVKSCTPYALGAGRGLSCDSAEILLAHWQATGEQLNEKRPQSLELAPKELSRVIDEADVPGTTLQHAERFNSRERYATMTAFDLHRPLPQLSSREYLGDDPAILLNRFFHEWSTPRRSFYMFMMRHQWCDAFLYFNAMLPRAHRHLLACVDIIMNMALIVLWYEVGAQKSYDPDDYLDWRSVEGCDPLDFWDALLVAIFMGIFFKAATIFPIDWLKSLQSKNFVYADKWEEKNSRRYLRWWRCKRWFFLLLIWLWIFFAVGFLMVFFANVAEDIQRDFLISAVTVFIQFFFLDSLAIALVFGCASGWILRYHPDIVDKTCKEQLEPKARRSLTMESAVMAEDKAGIAAQELSSSSGGQTDSVSKIDLEPDKALQGKSTSALSDNGNGSVSIEIDDQLPSSSTMTGTTGDIDSLILEQPATATTLAKEPSSLSDAFVFEDESMPREARAIYPKSLAQSRISTVVSI